jgi:hypothetical protein
MLSISGPSLGERSVSLDASYGVLPTQLLIQFRLELLEINFATAICSTNIVSAWSRVRTECGSPALNS